MLGDAITLYDKFAEGSEGYLISLDLTKIYAKEITGVQITDGTTTSDLISEEGELSDIASYINDSSAPDVAYAISSDIFYLYVNSTAYPYLSTTKFTLYGKRYAKPITAFSDNIDIRESEVELFINYALKEGALYSGKMKDPAIDLNIKILEKALEQ